MTKNNLAWRGAVVAIVALMAAGAFGCHRRAVVQDGRAERYQRHLMRYAARDTGCNEAQLVPSQIGQQPGVYTVTGCSFPVEYWLECGRGGRHCRWRRIPTLNEQAATSLGCQPQLIQQQLTQAPNVRIAAGCGQQASFQMLCNGAACGWAMTGPAQGAAPPPDTPRQAPPWRRPRSPRATPPRSRRSSSSSARRS